MSIVQALQSLAGSPRTTRAALARGGDGQGSRTERRAVRADARGARPPCCQRSRVRRGWQEVGAVKARYTTGFTFQASVTPRMASGGPIWTPDQVDIGARRGTDAARAELRARLENIRAFAAMLKRCVS